MGFRENVDWDKHTKDELIEMLVKLHADYHDRGHAMRHTSEIVRSLYAPKNERLNKANGKLMKQLKFERKKGNALADVVEDFIDTAGDLGFAHLERALASFKSGRDAGE